MIQLRWVIKTRTVKQSTNPGAVGAGTYDCTERYKVLQYREAENPISEHELHGIALSTWMDVPEETEE